MGYLQKVTNAYRDALMSHGVSEDTINYALMGFETGFNAGIFYNDDLELQEKMVKTILDQLN